MISRARRSAAASDTGVSLAFGNTSEVWGSFLQLLLNVAVLTAVARGPDDRRWSFLCMIAPLRLPTGTGSPVNPIAIV